MKTARLLIYVLAAVACAAHGAGIAMNGTWSDLPDLFAYPVGCLIAWAVVRDEKED